ncbi:MAG: RNA-binding domain-containing protein [Bacteroidota bacterium]
MSSERLQRLLKEPENIRLEFKEAIGALPGNLFESICAMLNRDGGDIILGANDAGVVLGVEESEVSTMVTNLVNLSNNKQKLDPPFILFPQTIQISGKWLIHIQVPASSQVHNTDGIIYDRSNDGDYRVRQPHQIAEIYNRKRNHYSEGIIYPALQFKDFKHGLFEKVRNLIRSNNANHPWLALNDKQLLEKAGLWKHDFHSGQQGYTLAAALLFGKDEAIQQIVPHFKIDALVRRKNILRYDDREYIQTNLIEAYEHLMAFVAKHLPDKFYMEGDQRVSLRTKIFREVVANMIVHREYTNAYPCSFIIYADKVETENANNPHGHGLIDPENFAPFPKNPAIAKFFIQLGRVDELGSGVLNVNRLIKEYSDKGSVQFIEDVTFKTKIPIDAKANEGVIEDDDSLGAEINTVAHVVNSLIDDGVIDGVIDGVNDGVRKEVIRLTILVLTNEGVKALDIATKRGKSKPTIERYLRIAREVEIVEFKGAPKTGGYYLTRKMKAKLT